jgi:hypothetical protein
MRDSANSPEQQHEQQAMINGHSSQLEQLEQQTGGAHGVKSASASASASACPQIRFVNDRHCPTASSLSRFVILLVCDMDRRRNSSLVAQELFESRTRLSGSNSWLI